MKKTRFTEKEQIIGVLKRAGGARRWLKLCAARINEATFYRWKAQYGGWRSARSSGSANWKMRTAA